MWIFPLHLLHPYLRTLTSLTRKTLNLQTLKTAHTDPGTTANTETEITANSETGITENTATAASDDESITENTPSDLPDVPSTNEHDMEQDSDSTATEEQTMELFSDTPTSCPSANGCKPAKLSHTFIPPRQPTAPKLVTGKPAREHSPDSDDCPAPKKPNTCSTNKHKHGKKKKLICCDFSSRTLA